MANWSSQNITLTAKGASALSKVQAGSGSLTITKVVASEQYVTETTLREVTSLSVENLPLTIIDRHEVQDGGSVIQVQLSNLYLGKAFTLNEIGVFATHSDNPSEEFLYIIAQVDANTGDKIPLYATTPVTATYDIYLYNVGADNINITISSAGLVTYEALNKACDIIQRNTAYEVGDILHSHSLKKGLAIKCTVAGITKSTDTDLSHKNVGDTVEDGTSQWVVIAPSTTADLDAHNHSVDAHPELLRKFIENGVNVIRRSHSYAEGDIAYSDKIPSWAFLECTVAGTTSDGWYFPEPSKIKVDDTIVDYTVTWKVCKVADTASKLSTARKINITGNATGAADFDGTSDVSINVTVNESKHAGAADSATTAAACSGNSTTATKLQTPCTISLSGNASGSANFDGSGNVSINTTVSQAATADALNSMGKKTAMVDGERELDGLHLYQCYDNGYPTTYGNVISLGGGYGVGNGGCELLAGWSGLDKGIERLYYRNRRDIGALWSDWRAVAFTSDIIYYAPTKTGGGASGTWDINISGNADTVDGYHASDLLRTLGGNMTPVLTDIFDRAGTIDMSTMSNADKATHKANINKVPNMTQNIWNNADGARSYGGDTDMNGYNRGTLKLTQSYKNFDKLMIVYTTDDGGWKMERIFDVYEFNYCMENLQHIDLLSSTNTYWYIYGFTGYSTDSNFKPSTETVLSCYMQNGGIIGIYGIKF